MPSFPVLSPGSRIFSTGQYAQTAYRSIDGQSTNVAHSNTMLASRLELMFGALSEAELALIFEHYNGQLGSFEAFQVPAAIFAGFSQITIGTGSGALFPEHRWRYVDSPAVEEYASDINLIRYNVKVILQAEPGQGAAVAGTALTIGVALAAGAVTASSAAPGSDLTLTLSLEAGTATAS